MESSTEQEVHPLEEIYEVIAFKRGEATDQHVTANVDIASLTFSGPDLTLIVGSKAPHRTTWTVKLGEHKIWELEQLAEALAFVANRRMRTPKFESREKVFADMKSLDLAVQCTVAGVDIFLSNRKPYKREKPVVDLFFVTPKIGAIGSFEAQEVLQFAEDLFAVIHRLAPHYVHWS